MSTVSITKQNALKAWSAADPKTKKIIELLIGEEAFNPGKITDRVKTYRDACEVLGLNVEMSVTLPYLKDLESVQAYAKLIIIARALNEGWVPDWTNSKQIKYVPWFEHKPGFGLSFDVCDDWYSGTNVGSRLCYKSAELAEYAAKQFADLYNQFLTLK